MKIGILSSGGDCPGINATIRGVGKTAIMHYGMEVIGIHSGFIGLLNKDVQVFDERSLSGILNLGGTILGTSREKPFRKLLASGDSEKPEIIKKNYEELGLDCLVCIGGNGTQKTANLLSQIGLNVIGVPKTIDNDIWGTDITFGFNTAVNIATESIDRLHSTASSHKRVMVVEVMGHHAGWIALYAGMAGGADVILLPELGYDIDKVNEAILDRARRGKPYSIVVDPFAGRDHLPGAEYLFGGTDILQVLFIAGRHIEMAHGRLANQLGVTQPAASFPHRAILRNAVIIGQNGSPGQPLQLVQALD